MNPARAHTAHNAAKFNARSMRRLIARRTDRNSFYDARLYERPTVVGKQFLRKQPASLQHSQVAATHQPARPAPLASLIGNQAMGRLLRAAKSDDQPKRAQVDSGGVEARLRNLGYAVIGTLDTICEDNWSALGLSMDKAHRQPFAQKLGIPLDATAYSLGRDAGHFLSLLQAGEELVLGATLFVSGASGFVAGVATTPEGFGVVLVPVAVDVIATGAAVTTHGVALGAATVMNMMKSEGNSKGKKPYSVNQMNQDIKTGRAPKTVKRVDKGVGADREGLGEQDQVHFEDGSALNADGSWKHGGGAHQVTNQEREWLTNHGWPTIPR